MHVRAAVGAYDSLQVSVFVEADELNRKEASKVALCGLIFAAKKRTETSSGIREH